ncbi:MAG: DUF6443 domain-containing protein [Bacteroidota bacterium]
MKTLLQIQYQLQCQSSLFSVVLTLLLTLPFSIHSQTNLAFEDDFSRPHLWEEIYIIPLNTNTGQLLTSDGDIHIDNGEVIFDDCADRSDKRVYRKVGSPLGQIWTLDVDFTPTAGGPHGVGHIIAGLTAGTENPYSIVPETVTSSYPTFTLTDQDGIFLEYLSPLYGSTSDYYLRLRSKDGTTYHAPLHCGYILPNGQTYYLRLSMANGSLTFQRFNDAARTDLEDDYALIVPSSVTGLNVIQHGNIPQGSYNRKLTATVDNVKLYDSSMPCVRCEDYNLFTTTLTENYVMSKTARKAVSSSSALDALSNTADAWVGVAYVDGLGRPLQEVSLGAAPDCQGDLVTYHQYDAFGREAIVDLPYVASGINGSFRDDGSGGLPIGDQRDFYDPPSPNSPNFPHIPTTDLAVPFSETVFEASPLNRPVEQGAPGADWQVGNQTIQNSYKINTTAHNLFNFGLDPQIDDTYGNYPAGMVSLVTTLDENDHATWTFTDKLGRMIMQQQEVDGPDVRTYYLYDLWGRVKYVLQPEGTKQFESGNYGGAKKLTQSVLDDFAFQYKYDDRGRVIEKKVPGADWIHLIYNKLDQVVLSQDGNQRSGYEWTFTKYDAFGRPIQTGIFTDPLSRDRAAMQSYVDGETTLHEDRDGSNFSSWHGYTNFAFPSAGITYHSVTYYDDYDYNMDGSPDVSYVADLGNFPTHNATAYTKGLVTGIRVWILEPEGDMPSSLLTSTMYDSRSREIQTIAENHLNGTDISWYEYDFVGQLLFSKHEHIGHDGSGTYAAYERSATIYKSYTYGPRGELIRTEQKTEDPDNPDNETEFVSLSEQRYDKLGQMTKKKLHYKSGEQYLQLGDYAYNIRGWLTQFNEPSINTPSGNYRDLFSMTLTYNGGFDPQYNGNIANMTWQTLGQGNGYHHYDFSYDKINRLTAAEYEAIDAQGGLINVDRYTVNNLSYDKSGNIESLSRYGKTGTNSYGVMDVLFYVYSGNQLTKVGDFGQAAAITGVEQFVDGNTVGDDYSYDANGNMITDKNKGINSAIDYNYLNKPTYVSKGSQYVKYIYSADGTKLRQMLVNHGTETVSKETDYLGAFHYEDQDGDGSAAKELLFFSHEEGRVRRAGTELVYETFLRDHLGNNRVMFFDDNEDGWVDPNTEVLQEDHFYPFGMRMAGASTVGSPAVPNQYLFTGKEIQDELGIGWVDFGARMYDASIGRWNGVDALAEKAPNWTPYRYSLNNPIRFIDPNGLWEFSTTQNDEGRTTLRLQKSNDNDNLESFIAESGLSKRQIRKKLFGGEKAAMAAFFGGNESSINVSKFSGKIGEMLQSMEGALNEGNDALRKAGDEAFAPGCNNCFNSTRNLTSDGQYDSRPLTEPDKSTFSTTMTLGSNFDRELGSKYGNTSNPQTGDAIRYSKTDGAVASHAAVYLLENGNGIQVFTKNGIENKALFQLSTSAKLEEIYGPATGRQNYQATRPNTVKNPDGTKTTTTETYTRSDRSPYYRKN